MRIATGSKNFFSPEMRGGRGFQKMALRKNVYLNYWLWRDIWGWARE